MRIACILSDFYEDPEFDEPFKAFGEAGHKVTIVGLEASRQVKGKQGKSTATVDAAFADVSPDQFDALFIPGGYSPDKLRAHPEPVDFVRGFFDADKPVLAICHGPQILISADVLEGRRLTAWKTIQGDLRRLRANVQVVDEEVVVDRNLVTSRKPDDIPAFNRESLKVLGAVPAQR
jgi:protease I